MSQRFARGERGSRPFPSRGAASRRGVMEKQVSGDRASVEETNEPAEHEFKIETPVIQMQDLEHQPSRATRVSNKGVTVAPPLDSGELRALEKEDGKAKEALEEFERSVREQIPG
jgi:hypothetical protein